MIDPVTVVRLFPLGMAHRFDPIRSAARCPSARMLVILLPPSVGTVNAAGGTCP